MGSPLPPDPYAALGVSRDATAASVKTAYRKLALKSHPDKFPDAEKAQKADEFHRIQQAYEILADQDRRERYNAQVRLVELRREAIERGRRSSEPAKDSPRAAAYDVRTPRGAYSARETKPSTRPEPKTRATYDSDERHYDDARTRPARRAATKVSFSYSRGPSPDRRRERIRVFSFGSSSTKHERSQNSKTRSQEKKRGTEDKFFRVNEDAEDSDRYEDRRRWHRSEAQRYEEEERRREEDEYKRVAEAERRAAEAERHRDEQRRREGPPRRSSKMHRDDPYVTPKVEEAKEYIRSSRTTPRGGTSSSDDARPSKKSYEKVRPSVSRRSSDKSQKDRILAGIRHGSARREKMPDIYERRSSPEDPRRRPPLEKADTMPSKYSSPKVNLERSATMDSYDRRDAPRPMRRSETLPSKSHDHAYERPAANSSKPRDMPLDSGYSSPSTPSTPTPPEREHWHTKSHSYHYSEDGGVPLGDNVSYHTVVVEPTDDDDDGDGDDDAPRRPSSSSQDRMRSSREEDRPTPTSTRASRRPATHTHHRSFAADPDPPRESHRRGRPTAGASSRHMSSAGPIPMTHSPEREYPEQQRESRGRDRDRDRDRDRAPASPVDHPYHDAAEHQQHHPHPHHHHHHHHHRRRRGSLWETSPPPSIPKQAGRPAAAAATATATAPPPTSRGAARAADGAGYTFDDVIFGPRLRSGFSSSTNNAATATATAAATAGGGGGKRGQIPRPGPITHPSVMHQHMTYTAGGGGGAGGEAKARMMGDRFAERERDAYSFPNVHIPRPPLVKRMTVN